MTNFEIEEVNDILDRFANDAKATARKFGWFMFVVGLLAGAAMHSAYIEQHPEKACQP